MNEEETILVCALADAPKVVPGSIFTHHCAICARRVMVAPSGQRLLATRRVCRIVCSFCFEASVRPEDEISYAAGTGDEVLDEARRARPNLRRNRN